MSILLAAALALTAQPSDPLPDHGFMRFSAQPAFGRGDTTVEVGVLSREGEQQNFWFRRRSELYGTPNSGQYATTETCPAVRPRLEELESLAMPTPDLVGYGREQSLIISDGVLYRLEGRSIHADGQSGEFMLRSNVGSPLARWIDAMLAALAPCWVSNPPEPS